MLREFNDLTEEETQRMFDAIPKIAVLVAAADDEIDDVEMQKAQQLADLRSYNNRGQLNAYYEIVHKDLTNRIRRLHTELPENTEERQAVLAERLSHLNAVLAKLPAPYGYLYYNSFRTYAKAIAESHGGFLRFITVGPKEQKVIDLPMLHPIEKPPVEEFPNLI